MNNLERLMTEWLYEDPRQRLENRRKPQVKIDRVKNTITMNAKQYDEYIKIVVQEPAIIPYADIHVGNLKIIINDE